MFERGHSFAWLVSIKSWPERWKPTERLLGTLKNDRRKRQTSGVSFHRVCETVTMICLNPLRETIVYISP